MILGCLFLFFIHLNFYKCYYIHQQKIKDIPVIIRYIETYPINQIYDPIINHSYKIIMEKEPNNKMIKVNAKDYSCIYKIKEYKSFNIYELFSFNNHS